MDSFGRGLKSSLASGESQYVAGMVICFWMSFFLLLGADDCREYDDSNDNSSSWMSLLSGPKSKTWDNDAVASSDDSSLPP